MRIVEITCRYGAGDLAPPERAAEAFVEFSGAVIHSQRIAALLSATGALSRRGDMS